MIDMILEANAKLERDSTDYLRGLITLDEFNDCLIDLLYDTLCVERCIYNMDKEANEQIVINNVESIGYDDYAFQLHNRMFDSQN